MLISVKVQNSHVAWDVIIEPQALADVE